MKRKDIHADGPFRWKMNELMKLSDKWKLFKATNPVDRDPSIADGYKERIRQRILDKYWSNEKDLATRLLARLSASHPDHIWEFRLGGPDTAANLRLLHGRTNTDIGFQIWQQIHRLPDGTPIRLEVVN